MLGKRQHRGEWGVVPDGAKRNYGSRRFEPLPTPHAFWYLALCALVVTGCSSDGRTPLVIYSPHGRDLLTLLERRFEQLHPGVDVRWLDMGSQEVYDRVRSERANPQADVWFGGPATMIARGLKATGDTAAGFQWLRRLDAQTKEYVLNGPLLDQKIARQEGLVTMWDLPDILLNRRDGLPLGYVFPASGTPVIEDAVAVVRGARHRDAARAFVEYVGSVEAQLLATREAYRLPARLDLPADSLPAWARDVRRSMKVADVDWDLLAERGAEWMRYWDEHVRGKGR